MATEYIVSLKASGGEYTSLTTWESDLGTVDLTPAATKVFSHGGITGTISAGDTVTGQTSGATGVVVGVVPSTQILLQSITGTFQSGEVAQVSAGNSVTLSDAGDSAIAVIECYKGDYSGVGGGTNYITDTTTIAGQTANATNYIVVRTLISERHDGTPGTGFYINRSFGDCINLTTSYTRVIGIEGVSGGGTNDEVFRVGSNCWVDKCIARYTTGSPTGNPVEILADGGLVTNTLIDANGTTAACLECLANIAGLSYNNTFINAAYGVVGASSSVADMLTVINCVSYNCTNFHDSTKFYGASSDYNASSTYSTQAPIGANSYAADVVSGDFVNTAGGDFHLSIGSNLKNIGSDLSGTFTDDVDGDTRSVWDIGFDEIADATAPVLSSPTGTATGSTTASGTVSTDEGNGTLYFYASTNASETAATIKASGSSQAVSGTGSQAVSFTGLTGSTTYYAHYVQDDASSNESNVVSSSSFKTGITIGNVFWDAPTGWEYAVYDGGVIPQDSVMMHSYGTDDTSSAAAFLTDTTASWTIDDLIGLKVLNKTDGSEGTITDNTATTVTATLSGGLNNNWDAGDIYEIVINLDTNDQIVYEEATSLGGTISAMSTKGVPTITGASGSHEFDVKYRDATDSKVSSTVTVTVTV